MSKPLSLPPGLKVRSGKFHYRFQLAGVEHTGSTGFAATERNLKAAISKMEAERRRLEAGESSTRLVPMPFSRASEAFCDWAKGEYSAHPNSARRLATSMVSLSAFFDRTPLHAISAGAVEDYKAWRRSCNIKEITLRHDLHALSVLCQYGIKHSWCRRNIVREVAIPSEGDAVRQYVVSPAEEAVYFAAAARYPQLYDVARLILLQGLRPEEVLSLRMADVDLEQRTVTVRAGKSRAARRVLRLVPEAIEILRRRVGRGGAWVFTGRAGRLQKVNGSHDKVLAATKLGFVLYDLRHTFATRKAAAGCPLATLAAILGHANLRTIGRYVHPTQQSQWDAMEQYGVSEFRPEVIA